MSVRLARPREQGGFGASRLGFDRSHAFGERPRGVEVAALLERLVDALRWSACCADGRVRLRVRAEEGVSLPPDVAVSLALAANEAATNACKHGFPGSRAGEVEVRLERRAEDGALVLAVRDDGVGLPAQTPGGGGLGLGLIRGLARKAGAALTLSGEGGTTVALALPAAPAAAPERRDGIPESSPEAGGSSAARSRALH